MTAIRDELADLISVAVARSWNHEIADAILARYAVVDRARFEAMLRLADRGLREYPMQSFQRESSAKLRAQAIDAVRAALAALDNQEGQS